MVVGDGSEERPIFRSITKRIPRVIEFVGSYPAPTMVSGITRTIFSSSRIAVDFSKLSRCCHNCDIRLYRSRFANIRPTRDDRRCRRAQVRNNHARLTVSVTADQVLVALYGSPEYTETSLFTVSVAGPSTWQLARWEDRQWKTRGKTRNP
jgi:hypothetical protein